MSSLKTRLDCPKNAGYLNKIFKKYSLEATFDMKQTSKVSYVSVTNVNFPLLMLSFCDKMCPLESFT